MNDYRNDHTENLVRDALAAEADRAPDPQPVLAALAGGRRRRLPTMAVVVTAAAAVAIAVAAVVVPRALQDSATPPADQAPPAAPTEQDVLLVGDDGTGRADAIMLAHLDVDGHASVVSLPRDVEVRVDGHGTLRLSAVAATAGPEGLVDAVAGLTGVTADHYLILPMDGFGPISEAAGGVPVCLRQATSDPTTGASFPAGDQTVAGADALAFLRQRMNLDQGDLDRVVRHQAFLSGLVERLAAGEVDLAALLRTVADEATLDPGWNLLDAADQLARVRPDRVRFGTIPLEPGYDAMLVADPERVRVFVESVFGDAVRGDSGGAPPPAKGVGCVD
ncbi:LCP family protein [Actinophytocola gossypii]|uniref:LCP family protein n=1 Tax=Actinophytocola gossypii TaxID=2812003 RepID=A0ABT2JEF9_9PSEU|nr:LCP family protein [Actinophytocola gossypii]MCT2586267.1 LCP family protein [Actinophytocola gossypii]